MLGTHSLKKISFITSLLLLIKFSLKFNILLFVRFITITDKQLLSISDTPKSKELKFKLSDIILLLAIDKKTFSVFGKYKKKDNNSSVLHLDNLK
jgi:hypothetical protein